MSLSLSWSVRASGQGQDYGRKLLLKEVQGRARSPLSREGYRIRSLRPGLPGLKSKKAAWLCGDHVEKAGWAFCSCKGRETCDPVRLSCSGQPAGWRGSCVSGEHPSGEAQDPAPLGLLQAPGLRCPMWKPLTTCGP